jgi:hypothetical protein
MMQIMDWADSTCRHHEYAKESDSLYIANFCQQSISPPMKQVEETRLINIQNVEWEI